MRCAILGCRNSSGVVNRNNKDVSYHQFPKDPCIKEKWIEATGARDWFPTKHSGICSIHFNEDDYMVTKKYRRLSRTAYPKNHIWKSSVEEDMDQESKITSNTYRQLETPRERRLRISLRQAQNTIRQQALEIKKIKEQNRSKILALESTIECLKNKFLVKEEPIKFETIKCEFE